VQTKDVRIDDIKVDPIEFLGYDTPERQRCIDLMARSLQEKGQLEPICINEDFSKIWAGHIRYLAAKKLGWNSIKATIMNVEEWKERIKAGRV